MPMPTCQRPGCHKPVKQTRSRYCSATCSQLTQKKDPSPTDRFVVTGNEAELTTLVEGRIQTLPQLIAACAIDTDTWEIDHWVCNKWDQGAVLHKSKIVVTQLFQVKAWLKKKVEVLAAQAEIAQLKIDAKASVGKLVKPLLPARLKRSSPSGIMVELAIPDLHAGKLAWAKETGYANYDTKIAIDDYHEAVTVLTRRACALTTPARILLPIGNDLFNADNIKGQTAAGTPQDTDVRFYKTFYKVRQMMVRVIDQLRLIAPVDVVIVPGNHDPLAVWHLGDSLECWFHTYPDVTINNHPTKRKYYHWDQVMLMFTHGDKGKPADYPLLMATEEPQLFGATQFRECHVGHLHQVSVRENHGVRVRVSPALCPPDAWHAENQYVGNQRGAEAFIWDGTAGLIGTAHFALPDKDN